MADDTLTAEAPDAPDAPVVDTARQGVVDALSAQFGDAILDSHIERGDLWVRVAPSAWPAVARHCKDVLGFRFFDFLSGIDWLNNPDISSEKLWDRDAEPTPVEAWTTKHGYTGGDTRFQVLARFYNIETHLGINFKVDLADDNPTVDTIVDVFAGAEWHERETWEMFGFTFTGHPGLRHLYLPGAFEGHPLRKDFPLLSREIRPWPGLVDKEPMPGEKEPDAAAGGSPPDGADATLPPNDAPAEEASE